jgi:PIN domain nuclease of toxin-antitoxin system
MDASAILAYLKEEKGQEIVEVALGGRAEITTVNYCEVLGKMRQAGMPGDQADLIIAELGVRVVDFDIVLARYAAELGGRTSEIGASLGDRACLALAHYYFHGKETPVVFTADQSWSKIKWPFKITITRPGK